MKAEDLVVGDTYFFKGHSTNFNLRYTGTIQKGRLFEGEHMFSDAEGNNRAICDEECLNDHVNELDQPIKQR